MVQSIELLFDDPAERALRGAWDALAAAGLPSLALHEGATNRPHVTVAVAETGLEAAAAAVGTAAEGLAAGLAAEVGAPLLFGGHRRRWVLTRQVVPSAPLLALHTGIHRAIRDAAPTVRPIAQTLPGGWTPHVSLARRIPADRLAEALTAIDVEPLPCRFVALRLWDSTPRTVTDLRFEG